MAAEILWLSLKVIWQQGVSALNKAWLGAKEFFVSTAYSMWYGALAAAEIVFHALEVAWIETTAFLSKTWTNFATGFQMIWEEASSWVAKRMLEIQGLFDDGLDVEAAKKAVDQQLETRLVELENAAQQSVTAREGQREQQRRDAAAMHEATLAAIGQDFENAQEALRKDAEAGLAESQAALDAAKQKLAAAIEEARKKREAADAEKGPGRPQRDLLADFEDRLSGLGAAIGKGISVTGTFSSAAVSGLGTGGDAAERTAKRAKERAKYLALANKPGSTYGSSNHGRAAIPLIQEGKPRFVVDFGCGRNDLVRELRRLGIDGLGVDFAFPEADLVRPMHATALQAGIADVVTSFDALEHLLPEDVDLTLAEMRRVAVPRGRFIFSICTRPSTTTVAGEGLHPTVRPLEWWLERIARVGVASKPKAESRYIVGRFKSDGGCCGA